MKRRTKLLLGALAVLAVAAGVAVWLVWFPPWAAPAEKWLLGAWEGSGEVVGDWSVDVTPDPAHNVSGGKASGKMRSACTVQAEFQPNGTYTWREQQVSGDAHSQMTFTISIPKEGEEARWKVVRADGRKLAIRIYCGDAVFDFQGPNDFTMTLPESPKASGTYTFHRR